MEPRRNIIKEDLAKIAGLQCPLSPKDLALMFLLIAIWEEGSESAEHALDAFANFCSLDCLNSLNTFGLIDVSFENNEIHLKQIESMGYGNCVLKITT